MDWDKALERNTLALLRIVGALFALLTSARLSGSGLMVPRHVWRAILFVLRPAEAAVRRLIIIAARAIVPPMLCARRAHVVRASGARAAHAFPIAPVFVLCDPLKDFALCPDEGGADGMAAPDAVDDAPVNAVPLHNRLRALRHALADLSAQAERLARFNARRNAALKAGQPARLSPMRPGLPPGWRERGKHEVDTVLKECHRLVRYLDNTS